MPPKRTPIGASDRLDTRKATAGAAHAAAPRTVLEQDMLPLKAGSVSALGGGLDCTWTSRSNVQLSAWDAFVDAHVTISSGKLRIHNDCEPGAAGHICYVCVGLDGATTRVRKDNSVQTKIQDKLTIDDKKKEKLGKLSKGKLGNLSKSNQLLQQHPHSFWLAASPTATEASDDDEEDAAAASAPEPELGPEAEEFEEVDLDAEEGPGAPAVSLRELNTPLDRISWAAAQYCISLPTARKASECMDVIAAQSLAISMRKIAADHAGAYTSGERALEGGSGYAVLSVPVATMQEQWKKNGSSESVQMYTLLAKLGDRLARAPSSKQIMSSFFSNTQ